jgi:phosphate-selective porin
MNRLGAPAALWLLLLCGGAQALDWKAGARLVLAHDDFAGVHGDATVGWLRRADLELQGRHGPWRALLNLRNSGDGQWPVNEFRLGWTGGDDTAGQQAWLGRFDPDVGLEPSSGSSANPLPEAAPVWDLAPHADDGSDAEAVQWRGWRGGSADGDSAGMSLLQREGRPQANVRLGRAWQGEHWAGVSMVWRPLALDDGRLRTRMAVRGSAEHPDGRRSTLAAKGEFGSDLLLAASATVSPAPGWRGLAELLTRQLDGRSGSQNRRAHGLVLSAQWSPAGGERRLDAARGRLRAPTTVGWAVTTRLSRLQVHHGGSASQATAGLEWRPATGHRLLAAWSHTRLREQPGETIETGRALALRWELSL